MPTGDHGSGAGTRPRSALRTAIAAVAGVVAAVAGLAFILFAPLPGAAGQAQAATIGRGIIDYRLEQSVVDVGAVPALVAEMGPERLRAGWTRVMVHWNALQPQAPGTPYEADTDGDGYSDAYVAQLTAVVDATLTPPASPSSSRPWIRRGGRATRSGGCARPAATRRASTTRSTPRTWRT